MQVLFLLPPAPLLQQYLILTYSRQVPTPWQKQSHNDTPYSLAKTSHAPLLGVSYASTYSTAVALQASKEVSMPTLKEREGRCAVILLAHHVSWAVFSTPHLPQGGYQSRGLEAQSRNRDYQQLNIELSCEAGARNISQSPLSQFPHR